jgi:hypothetical protein
LRKNRSKKSQLKKLNQKQRAMFKLQELNQDGSERLDANGNIVTQTISDATYYRLMDTPIGKKRWRRIKEPEFVPHRGTLQEEKQNAPKRTHKSK